MSPAQPRRPASAAASEGDGGIPARRAVARWAWRLFRREWRQQILVLALLTLAVTAAIGFATAAYNTAAVSDDAEFGTADRFFRFDGADPQTLQATVAAAEEWFAAIDVISQWYVPIPGSVESLEFRAQDPQGAFSAPMLALREGRYPSSAGEVAVTDWVAATFQLGIGSMLGLGGPERTVVGLVENPSDLNAEFALVAPADVASPESVTILVGGSSDKVRSFQATGGLQADGGEIGSRSGNEDVVAAIAVLGVATVALVLVSLVAAASFVVVAQRRLRQFGMLAAVGATEKHLRLVVVTNGAVIGVVAAVIGAAVGIAGWIAAAPRIESAVGHRIDPLNVPWWLVGTAMLLVVGTATGAAWWPARAVARVPITLALSGRPPRPRSVKGSAALAGLLTAAGVVCIAVAGHVADETAVSWSNALLISAGTVAAVVGIMLVSPLAIRALATAARWLPIATRLALRDLARYQARSGVALAAISLTLGIPAAIIISATAATAADRGNLSDRQLLVWTRDPDQPEGISPYFTEDPDDEGFSPFLPRLTSADLESLARQVDRIAALLDEPTVTALDLAMDPDLEPTPDGRLAVTLARTHEPGLLDVALVYVASSELLEHYGLALGAVEADTDVLTVVEAPELWFLGVDDPRTERFDPEVVTNIERIAPGYSSLPGSFITSEALRARGWESRRVGWLVETSTFLTGEQIAAARKLAADAGLLIEARDHRESLLALRWQATGAGMLVALGILAMTLGLIRSEAAGDLRTLTATGATSTTRRNLTAATAGALALLGALLGTIGAYMGLIARYLGDIGALTPVPVLHLTAIAVGIPLAAALTGWLLAGREPPALARQPIG